MNKLNIGFVGGLKGEKGDDGAKGAKGDPCNNISYRGAWVAGTSYTADAYIDVVLYNTIYYYCKADTNGTLPPDADFTHWGKYVSGMTAKSLRFSVLTADWTQYGGHYSVTKTFAQGTIPTNPNYFVRCEETKREQYKILAGFSGDTVTVTANAPCDVDIAFDFNDIREDVSVSPIQPSVYVYITLTAESGKSMDIYGDTRRIDWGDGTITNDDRTHTYKEYGDYVIKLHGKLECEPEYSGYGGDLRHGVLADNGGTIGKAIKRVEFFENAIGKCALAFCGGLQDVVLHGDETEIPDYAFRSSGITQMPMHENIRRIGVQAFRGCELATITIPSNVVVIREQAFYATGVNEDQFITFEDSESYRDLSENYIFASAGVRTMYLPKRISAIGYRFIYNNHGAADIYYNGTEDEFAEIPKSANWISGNYTIHYLEE